MRLWVWLRVMDVLAWRWFGSRAYLWAVHKASDAVDWSQPGTDVGGEVPF